MDLYYSILLLFYILIVILSISSAINHFIFNKSFKKATTSLLILLISILRVTNYIIHDLSANGTTDKFLADLPLLVLYFVFTLIVVETVILVIKSQKISYVLTVLTVAIYSITILFDIILNSLMNLEYDFLIRDVFFGSLEIYFAFAFFSCGIYCIYYNSTSNLNYDESYIIFVTDGPVYIQICGWSFAITFLLTFQSIMYYLRIKIQNHELYLSLVEVLLLLFIICPLFSNFYFKVMEFFSYLFHSSLFSLKNHNDSLLFFSLANGVDQMQESLIHNSFRSGSFLSNNDTDSSFLLKNSRVSVYKSNTNTEVLDHSLLITDKSTFSADFLEVNDFELNTIMFDPESIKIGKRIGIGNFGEVFHGILYCTTPVAVKRLFLPYQQQSIVLERFVQEVSILKRLSHPNVVLFMGIVKPPTLGIVMEYMDFGSVHDLLYQRFDKDWEIHWDIVMSILRDTARGMCYLHSLDPPIIHRDLKPANLLINSRYQVKITDFGIARSQQSQMTAIGTAAWMAPEIIRNAPYSISADVYSFGILMYEICTRSTPFGNDNPMQVIFKVINGDRPKLPALNFIPPVLMNLMQQCWSENPLHRPIFSLIYEILNAINPDPSWENYPSFLDSMTQTKDSMKSVRSLRSVRSIAGTVESIIPSLTSIPGSYTPSNNRFGPENDFLFGSSIDFGFRAVNLNPLPPLPHSPILEDE